MSDNDKEYSFSTSGKVVIRKKVPSLLTGKTVGLRADGPSGEVGRTGPDPETIGEAMEEDLNNPFADDNAVRIVPTLEVERYRKIKDDWYFGPITGQLPDGLYHLHAARGAGLGLKFDVVWRMDKLLSWREMDIEIEGNGVPIYGCNCGAIAPDEVVGKIHVDRKAAVAAARRKTQKLKEYHVE